jgi:hypothetical protein
MRQVSVADATLELTARRLSNEVTCSVVHNRLRTNGGLVNGARH